MDWKNKMASLGYRISEPRKRIMEVLESAEVALSPQQIHQQLELKGLEIGLVSVYRTLDLLTSLELVTTVYDPERNPGYVLSSTGHHHHIICQKCHRAIEFSGTDDIRELIKRVETETSFHVEDHLLQLFGICPECLKSMSNRGEK